MNKKLSILTLLVVLVNISLCQKNKLTETLRYYQSGNLDIAKTLIDEVSKHSETIWDANTWYYRGYIYKDLYTQRDKANKQSPFRTEAVNSFLKQMELDTYAKLRENVVKNINYLAVTIYNDAATSINAEEYRIAIVNFDLYKKIMHKIEPEKSFYELDKKFQIAMDSISIKIYGNDSSKIYIPKTNTRSFETRIPLEKIGKSFKLRATVNDKLTFDFILDTGADNVVISPDVFITYWKAGEIKKSDILEWVEFSIADGSTAIGLKFIIKKITMEDITVENVIASVLKTPNDYDMLLGMSVLERFGKYTIDHTNNVLIINR